MSTKDNFNFLENMRKIISETFDYKVGILMIKYFLILFIIDYTGKMDLSGQNYIRRAINMYRRRDSLTYGKKLDPFCKSVVKILNEEDIKKMQSIEIPKKRDTPWFSRKNTTTHQMTNLKENEKKIVLDIAEKVKSKYEKIINKKLYFMKSPALATIYLYHGSNSQHLWHVDPRNLNTVYNSIVCFKRKGNISPLECKDNQGKISSIHFQPGDAAIFRGGTTVHQVPPNDDPNSERYVLALAFTSDEELAKSDPNYNMCTFIEGGSNVNNILKMFLSTVVINLFVSQMSKSNDIPYSLIVIVTILTLLSAKYLPMYCDIGLGSGRPSSIGHNLILLVGMILLTLSVKGGTLFFTYFALSDVFFPRSLVEYT